MSDHHCDKVMTIESHGREIGELYEQGRDREARMTEMETVLFGHERNGGGFIRETKETMEIVREGQASQSALYGDMAKKVDKLLDKKQGWREVARAVLPAVVTAAAAVIAVALK